MQNCWEFKSCKKGPHSENPCKAASNIEANTFMGGINGGRACFYIHGTACEEDKYATISQKWLKLCSSCEFYNKTKLEMGGMNYLAYLFHINRNQEEPDFNN
ncbi:MAG: hypothetical protein HeimC2_00240 [Candidatus Heimdallarchaeota archaeon LC_2]|nr:MAG: hypothetical protein HeimC2_00240 [Candidatus Heimdallarchaeota archaeon LC_2]